jgi:hypothetical protein
VATRTERVVLELDDRFSSSMARAAAMTALLSKELNSLSGQSTKSARLSQSIARDTDSLAKSAQKADTSINQLTGRLRVMAQAAAILGPALVPVGAVGIPAVAGLANQLGAAALAAGTAVAAFQGVGGALEAVNKAAIEPTAANLDAAREAMRQLSPAARDMVNRLQELRPVLEGIRDSAATGLFPGVIEMFNQLETRGDEATRIFRNVAEASGELAAAAGADLASARWTEFFDFLATDVPDTLTSLGHTVGDLAHGMAELWQAFDPLSDDFNGWLRDVASGFDDWASGLAQTEGFAEFLDYVRTTGPQVADTFGALANAVVQIAQAAAPLGGPVLAGLEAVADVIATIADSDLGTPIMAGVVAWGALTSAVGAYKAVAATAFGSSISGMVDGLTTVTSAQERATTAASRLGDQATYASRAVSGIGAGLAIFGAIEGINLLDAAFDNLLDRDLNTSTLGRSLDALASGNVIGTVADVWGSNLEGLNTDLDTLDNNLARITDLPDKILPGDLTATQQAESNIAKLDEALAALVESGNGDQAAAIFDQLIKKAKEGGNSAAQLTALFEQYGIAVRNVDEDSQAGADGIDTIGAAAARAEGNVDRLTAAFEELNGFFDKRAAMRNYQAALDEFQKGLKDTGRSFDINTEKGRANQERLDAIGTAAIQAAEDMGRMRRVEFVSNVVGQLRTMAANLQGPARQSVLDVIAELKELARQKPKPKVELDARAALAGIDVVAGRLRDLDGDEATVRIYQDTVERHYRLPGGGRIPINSADGGYIRGPGGPRDDLVPANLSNGEYVVRAAAVERYGREMFDRLNAMNFANGGYVSAVPVSAPSRSYATTERVVERVVERGGPTVVKVYDVDNQLIGTMRGEVDAERGFRDGLRRAGML